MGVFFEGLGLVFTLANLFAVAVGVFLGIIVGAIPGLTPSLALVLCMPFTYGMPTVPGILLLLSLYCAGTYGGSITAILIRTPGTPAASCTVLDGYPLAQQGKARTALDMALYASTAGGLISALILLAAAPQIAKLTIRFGPVEYFSIALFGLSVIVSVSGKNLFKGIIAACLGLFVSMVGIDQTSGVTRYNFGIVELMGGIEIILVLIGLFGVAELFSKAETFRQGTAGEKLAIQKTDRGLQLRVFFSYFKTVGISSLIGTGIGALPGTGAGLASFLSYDAAKKRSKHPETFGEGELDGVAAAESGNNAVTGATLIPLLTLGIPGDGNVAILLGALLMKNMVPGPQLFTEQGSVMYAIMIGLLGVNLMMLLQGKVLVRFFAKVSDIPYPILAALVSVFCFIGAYAATNLTFNIFLVIFFGVLGYAMRKLDFPVIPLMLGLVLGQLMETNFRRAIVLAKGDYSIFVTRPISLVFLLLTVGSVGMALYKARRKKEGNV